MSKSAVMAFAGIVNHGTIKVYDTYAGKLTGSTFKLKVDSTVRCNNKKAVEATPDDFRAYLELMNKGETDDL